MKGSEVGKQSLKEWQCAGVKLDPASLSLIRTLLDLEDRLSAYSEGVRSFVMLYIFSCCRPPLLATCSYLTEGHFRGLLKWPCQQHA